VIQVNERESALECSICRELEGVSAKALKTPELLEKLKARVAREHAGCERYAHDPKRARTERQFSRSMAAELRLGNL
jgi:hypothetical protein